MSIGYEDPEEEPMEPVEPELEVGKERPAPASPERNASRPDDPDRVAADAPTRRDRAKPLELLAISAGCGVFAGLITLLVTRDWLLTGVMFGVAFIIGLVVLAMLSLGGYEPQQPPSPKGYLVDNERRQDEGH